MRRAPALISFMKPNPPHIPHKKGPLSFLSLLYLKQIIGEVAHRSGEVDITPTLELLQLASVAFQI